MNGILTLTWGIVCCGLSPFSFLPMVKHHLFNIEWIGYPNTRFKVPSVYFLEGIYIGASVHTRQRIVQHCYNAVANRHFNKDLGEYLRLLIEDNLPITVFFLDSDIYKEGNYINHYNPVYNISSITYSNRSR